MLPRKRVRPNPAEAASTTPTDRSTTSLDPRVSTSQAPSASETSANSQDSMPAQRPTSGKDTALAGQDTQKQARKTKSWYGSWPRQPKASASTSIARENILGGTVRSKKAPDLSRFETQKNTDAASLHSTAETLSGLSQIPENNSSEPMIPRNQSSVTLTQQPAPGVENQRPNTEAPTTNSPETTEAADDEDPKSQPSDKATDEPTTPQRPTPSSSWLGWWSRTPFTETQVTPMQDVEGPGEPPKEPPVETPPVETAKEADEPRPATPPAQAEPEDQATEQALRSAPAATYSWFGFWYSSSQSVAREEGQQENVETVPQPTSEDTDVTMTDAPPPPPPPPPPQPEPEPAPAPPPVHKHEPGPKAGSTWVFWAKDSPKANGKAPEPESGEIAIMGDGSEAHPRPMMDCDVSPAKEAKPAPKAKEVQTGVRSWRRNKRLRPPSMDIDAQSQTTSGASTPTKAREAIQPAEPPTKAVDPSSKSIAEAEASSKSTPNLLLPSFSSTYRMKENPSILKQVTQFLLRTEQSPPNHVFRLKEPPKIRKAIAIGVHGLFPASYLRPMIGQPTGTSLRFASLCAEAIRRWAEAHDCGDCEIEKVALEGEGKINDRVDNLWKLMLNWIDHIRSADLVLIACHSQGVPVSIMLLEKLIDLGVITGAKIGVCAMAGVSLGPFPEYKSGLLMGSAAELWEFGNADSNNSKRFQNALQRVLDYGTRITFIGSIDDQLVPMESAVYSPANHPHIYRAVFIDGRVHAPDFIAHLVGFALKLRNLGVSDHGLIRELSIPLAGSLYSGEGHSRLYYDSAVYDLAVSHALETTTIAHNVPCQIARREALATPNPYVLPWIMRGLLEEDFVKTELNSETEQLLKQFDDWKPVNKALKDVKYRLEAVRSKL